MILLTFLKINCKKPETENNCKELFKFIISTLNGLQIEAMPLHGEKRLIAKYSYKGYLIFKLNC